MRRDPVQLAPSPGCLCDTWEFPPALDIAAGEENLERRIAAFPAFRKALLAASAARPALTAWKGRDANDLGVMLLEMGAYVFDTLCSYDEILANESYLRTAKLRPSVRKLVSLLGYRPRPAVGARATLAAIADGTKPVPIRRSTAFRSEGFDGQAPQVFELDSDTDVRPWMNSWAIERPRRETVGTPASEADEASTLLLQVATARLSRGDTVLVFDNADFSGTAQARSVASVETIAGRDGNRYTRAAFNGPIELAGSTPLSGISVLVATARARTWTGAEIDDPLVRSARMSAGQAGTSAVAYASAQAFAQGRLLSPEQTDQIREEAMAPFQRFVFLDGRHDEIRRGDRVVLKKDDEYRWYTVADAREAKNYKVEQIEIPPVAGTAEAATEPAGIAIPAVVGPVTILTLDASINALERSSLASGLRLRWQDADLERVSVFHGFTDGGAVTVEAQSTLLGSDPIALVVPVRDSEREPVSGEFALVDAAQRAVELTGILDLRQARIGPDRTPRDSDLDFPVMAFGNLLTVSRGESVKGEVLGNGDASLVNQTFKLARKPLTYLPSPTAENDSGVASTLEIYVGGVRWAETPTFFGAVGDAPVYIVRQDDEDNSFVTFGDGLRGARLPTGTANVLANYRHGAGSAAPPAGSIHQIARPAKGLSSVMQPMAAGGGEDAEPRESMQTHASRSALLLGRAVSGPDIEAVAAQYPGVRAASAQWRWDGSRQRPVMEIWYVGDSDLSQSLRQTILSLTDPSTPIRVNRAKAVPSRLDLGVAVDACRLATDVFSNVEAVLLRPRLGHLVPESLGIGKPVFRSEIFESVLQVPGALAVRSLRFNGGEFKEYARTPGAGRYYDFERGGVFLTTES